VRIIVELHHTDDEGINGTVIADAHGTGEPHPFTGWLELLRLLETPRAPSVRALTIQAASRRRRDVS
jgi:hypothetical protein